MLGEFKKFILRGDVVALATGVIIAGAFGKIIDALIKGFITPLINSLGGTPDVSLGFDFRGQHFDIGAIISALIGFLITAAVIFFFIVKPSQALMARLNKEEKAAPPAPPPDVVLLKEIRDLLAKK
jgi:large conductance mechanosensitive channel